MGFQKGDVPIIIDGAPHYLRLTIGGLAEISEQLSSSLNNFATIGPRALSQCLRSLSVAEARVLLTCLVSPPIPTGSLPARDKEIVSAAAVSDEDMTQLLPAICRVFEQAFSGG